MAKAVSKPQKELGMELGIKEIRALVVKECFKRRHDGTCLRGKCLRTDMMRRMCVQDDADALLTDEEMKEKATAMGIVEMPEDSEKPSP